MSDRQLKELAKRLAHMAVKKSMGGATLSGGKVHRKKSMTSRSRSRSQSRSRSHSRGAGFQYDVPTLYDNLEIGGRVHHRKIMASRSRSRSHSRSHSRGAGFQYDVPTLYDNVEIGGRVHHRHRSQSRSRGGASLSGGRRVRKTNRPLNSYQIFVREFARKNPNLIGKDLIRHAAQAYRM